MSPTLGTSNPTIRTILLCDLVASTQVVERVGDAAAADLLARHDRIGRDLLSTFNGREIDKSDGFLLLFERPIEAVRFAMAATGKWPDCADEVPYDFKVECEKVRDIPKEDFGFPAT